MEKNHQNNPSKDSSSGNKSPPSPPAPGDTHAPNSTNDNNDNDNDNDNDEGVVMKTPWQVLEELGGYDDDGGGGSSSVVGGGAPVAVGGGGTGSTVVEGAVAVSEEGQVKKRKAPVVRDPPKGKPICPVCNREFPSWKSAFGHMRAHPNRDYRGFYKPPVFGSPSSTQNQPPSERDDAKKSGDDNISTERIVQALAPFDLNEPLPDEEEGESSHVVEPAEENEERAKGFGLDLNEIPPADEDEDCDDDA